MELSQKVYDVTLIKYQEGLATSLELIQANDRYLLSQSNYIHALLELLNAKNNLDRIRNFYD
jgi:outer membrane protein